MNKKRIFISAGEPSGDLHAARLMAEIKKIYPEIEFVGLGGNRMEAEGLRSIIPISDLSVVGFWEVAKKYRFFKEVLNKCSEIISSGDIDLFIPIDYPGFNMRLAANAKKAKVPVVYYIAPQLWAWGKDRAKKLARVCDRLLVLFPFEEEYFSSFGINTTFVGHPLLDNSMFDEVDPADKKNIIAFLPGSRIQEIKRHGRLIRETAILVEKELPEFEICIARPESVDISLYKNICPDESGWNLMSDSIELMKLSRAGLVKTGTSTLEAALCLMPYSMFYHASALTYFMGKKLINLEYISLANILMKEFVVKEFVQRDARPENISSEIVKLAVDGDYANNQILKFKKIREILGKKGASENAAKICTKDYLL